jgi:phosphatidylglycerol---prolipoprotein diacylglyceryl transferase
VARSKKKSSQRKATLAKNAQARQDQAGSVPAGLQRSQSPGLGPANQPGLAPARRADMALAKSAPPSPGQWRQSGLIARKSGSAEAPARTVPKPRVAQTAVGAAKSLPIQQSASSAPAPDPATAPDESAEELPAWAARALEEVLMLTYWIDPGEHGEPFTATIRFTGRRKDVAGKPQPGDTFAQDETARGIVPGSGPVAITTEVRGVTPGEWSIAAQPVTRSGTGKSLAYPQPGADGASQVRVPWPRRIRVPAEPPSTAHTIRLMRSTMPGITRIVYATLVSLGVLVGLGVETLLLHIGHYSALGPLMYSLAGVAAGAVAGKAWYVAVQGGKKFDGWCIQGFVAGAAVVIGVAAIVGPGTPSASLLSVAAPALLIGMAVGRPGCFWAGCCTGRPTAARWGIWSSDRRLGCRREPAQLLEALSALVIGAAVLSVVLLAGFERSGPVAVAGLAAYTLVRQFIIGMRAEPRRWQYGRRVTGAIAAIALIASIVLFVVG